MKQILHFLLILFLVFLFAGCKDSNKKLQSLESQIDSLKNELSLYKTKYGELQINQANENEASEIWKIKYYIDSFGDFTDEGYITNSQVISGSFSNSATTNSELGVSFLITDKDNLAIMLYEYMRNTPVKDDGLYIVTIKDATNNIYKLNTFNHSDRLVFTGSGYYDKTGNNLIEKSHARMMWNILIKGGEVKFRIEKADRSTTTYNFSIPNTEGLEQLYLDMSKKKKKE